VSGLVALLPVTTFLVLLVLFDSFKLVPKWFLLRALVVGAVASALLLPLHHALVEAADLPPGAFARYVAPVTEETLKTLCLLYPLWRRQIGFLVDAAILGFAIGAGFALVENLDYLRTLPDPRMWVWVVRGFGTAILHATTTAIVAITAKSLADRYPARAGLAVLPGWAAAVALHSLYNHALVSPVLAASILVFVLPLVVLAVFGRSERKTREWVGGGLDLDMELLDLVRSAEFGATRLGRYLHELKSRFPGPVVADMFCLLQLDLELAIRAKGLLMAREAGLEVPPDPVLKDRLAERAYLRRAIGKTGLLALHPLQMTNERDDWHRYLLKNS
jgi:RsiW-degrading membrane proteinase PrsW (M82 family)